MDRYNLKHLRPSREKGEGGRKIERMNESNREEIDKRAHKRERGGGYPAHSDIAIAGMRHERRTWLTSAALNLLGSSSL